MSVNPFGVNEGKAHAQRPSELQLHASHDRYQKNFRHKSEYLRPPNT